MAPLSRGVMLSVMRTARLAEKRRTNWPKISLFTSSYLFHNYYDYTTLGWCSNCV